MVFSLPVIFYDCTAGSSNLINDEETDFLTEERDPKKIKKLMQSEELRNKQTIKALEKIKDFDSKNIADHFFTFVTE
jgi:hypothetical protein